MKPILVAAALITPMAMTPLHAQDDLTTMSRDAVSALSSAAQSALLISEKIGTTIVDPQGNEQGTIRDFVVIPGGRVVAVLIEPAGGGDLVPVPYQAVTLATASGAAASLPATLESMQSSGALEELNAQLSMMNSESGGEDG